jgi:ketosteroid isomerase-like protein
MSQGNVEIIMRQFEAWSQGDDEAWAEGYDPDVVVKAPEGWPDGEVSEGLEAWRLQAQRLRDDWQDVEVVVDAIEEVAPDRVVARIRYVTRAEGGMSFDTPMGVAFFLRDGKIVRANYHWDVADAQRSAGLSI